MSRDPKQTVRRYLDALLDGDLEAVRDCFHADATWTIYGELPIAGPWHGRDQIVDSFLGELGGSLFEPGTREIEVPTLIAEDDTVVLEWRVTGRTRRGASYDNHYCGVIVVRGGRIATVREYLDSGYAARVLFA